MKHYYLAQKSGLRGYPWHVERYSGSIDEHREKLARMLNEAQHDAEMSGVLEYCHTVVATRKIGEGKHIPAHLVTAHQSIMDIERDAELKTLVAGMAN